jgi:hypothetical protein
MIYDVSYASMKPNISVFCCGRESVVPLGLFLHGFLVVSVIDMPSMAGGVLGHCSGDDRKTQAKPCHAWFEECRELCRDRHLAMRGSHVTEPR